MQTYQELLQEIDNRVNTNGTQAITGSVLNGVLKKIVANPSPRRKRIILSTENLVVPSETEMHFAQDLYVKGQLTIENGADSDYGSGLPVHTFAIVRVDGTIVNEGLIINNGLIIT